MEQSTIQMFVATRDSLKNRHATLAALIDFAEGNILSIFSEPFIFGALKSRGLVWVNSEIYQQRAAGIVDSAVSPIELTDYGRAFVSWYRQPRELPAQISMFDE